MFQVSSERGARYSPVRLVIDGVGVDVGDEDAELVLDLGGATVSVMAQGGRAGGGVLI